MVRRDPGAATVTPLPRLEVPMNWSRFLAASVVACSALAPARPLAIGTPDDQGEDIFSLGEVVVTGQMDGIEAGQTVHEISAEQIKKSSARTLDEALEALSDVNVRVGNEGVPRVDIRGFRTRHVLLLLDGIPMNSTFDQQFDPSLIPVDQIARIKVTAGASSVLYGQGGLGGVINVITKKGQKGLAARVGAESGDGAPYLVRGSVAGGKGMFDFLVSGSAYRRNRFPLAEPFKASPEEAAGYRKNSDNTRRNGYLNLGFSPSERLYLAFTGSIVQGWYGKPASAITSQSTAHPDGDPYASQPRFGRVDGYLGYTLQLAADYTASSAFSLRSMAYFNRMGQSNTQYDDETYTTYDRKDVPNSFHVRNTGLNSGISLQPKLDLARAGTFTLGLSAEWDVWSDFGGVKPGDGGGAAGGHGIGGGSYPWVLNPVRDHRDVYIYSAALEYQVSPLPGLGLAGGYAHHWQRRAEATPSGYGISASAHYDVSKSTRLKAAFQRNIRFPSLSQLYLKDSANPDLRPERVNHYQVGVDQALPWASALKVDLFWSDAYDFIALNQRLATPQNINFSHFRFYGVETALESRPVPRLTLKAGYTYLRSRDLSGAGMDELQYVPEDKATFIAKYDFDFGLTPFVSALYVAHAAVYTKKTVDQVGIGKKFMADYGVVNVKLSQRLFGDRLLIYVGADNILNKDYEQSYGIPRPGRFIYGGFEGHVG